MRYTYNYWLDKISQIVPNSVLRGTFYIMPIFLILIFVWMTIVNYKVNDEYFNNNIHGKVDTIILTDEGFNYRIDSIWYLIKHPIVNHIEIGDLIEKDAKSLRITIKNNRETKVDGEVRGNIIFYKIEK